MEELQQLRDEEFDNEAYLEELMERAEAIRDANRENGVIDGCEEE